VKGVKRIMSDHDSSGKIPNQKELEKELSEYLSKKYGNRVKVISPFVFPKSEESPGDDVPSDGGSQRLIDFDMLPEELESYLSGFVVKQDQAKAVLATKVCTHFNRIAHIKRSQGGRKKTTGVGMIKNNILMIGPTGVGKTYIVKLIAQKLGVPFVKGDATKFSETGYVGGDVEDLVRDLVYEAKEDTKLAENGIIYIDEIDKIASTGNFFGHDVSRTGVQRALLKPMEETEVDLKVPHDPISQIQAIEQYRRTGKKEKRVVNTKNILFIMSGAFGALGDIIKKRLQRQGIGFEADVRSTEVPWEILKQVTAQDLIEFGFESEFVGRMPVVVVFDELTVEDLIEILKNPNNPIIVSKRMDFRAYGIDIRFEGEALRKIAEIAAKEKTGARALVSVTEKVLVPFEKALPSTNIRFFLVTPEVVQNPHGELQLILADPDSSERKARFEAAKARELEELRAFVRDRAEEFRKKSGLELYEKRVDIISQLYLHNISDMNTAFDDFEEMYHRIKMEETSLLEKLDVNITFSEAAIDEILRQSVEHDQDGAALVRDLAKKLEYGLKLVKDRTGASTFTIPEDAVTNMEQYINELIKRSYRHDFGQKAIAPEEADGFTA
jgi:ATP-dependent Clp protease ATP-binding subunit ClpX